MKNLFFFLLLLGLLLLGACGSGGSETLLEKQAKHRMVVTYEFTQHKKTLTDFTGRLEDLNLLWMARIDLLDTLDLSTGSLEKVVRSEEINQLHEIVEQDPKIIQVVFRVGNGKGFSPHLELLDTKPGFQNLYEGWSFGFMELVNNQDSALWQGSAYPIGEDYNIDNCKFVRYDVLLFTSEARFWIKI